MEEEVRKALDLLEKRILKLEGVFNTVEPTPSKKLAIKEFLLSKKTQDEVETTLVIAYFLEKYDGMTSFTAKDIEDGFRRSKEPVPSNVNDKIYRNTKKGFLMDAPEKKDGKKAWTFTNSGENYVNGKLNQQ